MGYYIISNFGQSENLTNKTINISGKDKMCRLNGEFGGTVTSLTLDAGTYTDSDGTIHKIPLKDIIFNLVKTYGEERNYNIIIKDLDETGKELLEYRGETPLYLFENIDTKQVQFHTLDPEQVCYLDNNSIKLNNKDLIFKKIVHSNELVSSINYSRVKLVNEETAPYYYIIKLEYGEVAGYKRLPELVYAGDLIANFGEKITSILDKIKQMLGNYEYFYNLDGQFVFQRKKNIIAMSSPQLKRKVEDGENNTQLYYISNLEANFTAFEFKKDQLFVSKSKNHNLNNIKNDFVVWGKRDNRDIFARYAIDKKPKYYRNYNNQTFCADGVIPEEEELLQVEYLSDDLGQYCDILFSEKYGYEKIDDKNNFVIDTESYYLSDWRELIYRMALDYQNHNSEQNYYEVLKQNNPELVKFGQTGYEKYYTDLSAFWREVYDPEPQAHYNRLIFEEVEEFSKDNYVYSDAFIKITPQEAQNIADKNNLYTIKNIDGFNELTRYIDTLNYFELFTNAEGKHTLYNLYYGDLNREKKIIDSLDFITQQVYLEPNEESRLFLQLSEEEQDRVYYSTSINGKKYKLQDYVPVTSYSTAMNFIPYGRVYIKLEEKGEYLPLNSISITRSDKEESPLIWQYDYEISQLDQFTIEMLIEAVRKYKAQLVFNVYRQGIISGANVFSVYIKGEYDSSGCILWYKENNIAENYIYLNDKFLQDGSIELSKFQKFPADKHNVYFMINNTFYKAIDLISIDKALLKVYDSEKKKFVNIMSLLQIPDDFSPLYYFNPNEKMCLTNKEENVVFNQFYWDTELKSIIIDNGNLAQYYLRTPLNIFGEKLVLDFKTKSSPQIQKLKIPYYSRNFDYILKEDKDYRKCWNKKIYEDFTSANFWFDFIESDSKINDFSVQNIGDRIKTEKNDKISAIDYGAIPDIIYVPQGQIDSTIIDEVQIEFKEEELNELFSISGQGLSAKDSIETMLDSLIKKNITMNLSVIPIYTLGANSQIKIDENYYNVSKITIPLTYNGTMTLEVNLLE